MGVQSTRPVAVSIRKAVTELEKIENSAIRKTLDLESLKTGIEWQVH